VERLRQRHYAPHHFYASVDVVAERVSCEAGDAPLERAAGLLAAAAGVAAPVAADASAVGPRLAVVVTERTCATAAYVPAASAAAPRTALLCDRAQDRALGELLRAAGVHLCGRTWVHVSASAPARGVRGAPEDAADAEGAAFAHWLGPLGHAPGAPWHALYTARVSNEAPDGEEAAADALLCHVLHCATVLLGEMVRREGVERAGGGVWLSPLPEDAPFSHLAGDLHAAPRPVPPALRGAAGDAGLIQALACDGAALVPPGVAYAAAAAAAGASTMLGASHGVDVDDEGADAGRKYAQFEPESGGCVEVSARYFLDETSPSPLPVHAGDAATAEPSNAAAGAARTPPPPAPLHHNDDVERGNTDGARRGTVSYFFVPAPLPKGAEPPPRRAAVVEACAVA